MNMSSQQDEQMSVSNGFKVVVRDQYNGAVSPVTYIDFFPREESPFVAGLIMRNMNQVLDAIKSHAPQRFKIRITAMVCFSLANDNDSKITRDFQTAAEVAPAVNDPLMEMIVEDLATQLDDIIIEKSDYWQALSLDHIERIGIVCTACIAGYD